MDVSRWAPETETRITVVFRESQFGAGDAPLIDTDSRFSSARECLNWSVQLVESLHQLRELVALDDPDGAAVTPLGYRASSVNVGHVLWAAVTGMGVLDRLAAALGALQLDALTHGRLYDFSRLWQDLRAADNESVRAWMRGVRADPAYRDVLRPLRDPMTHRTLLRRVTATVKLADVFSAQQGDKIPSMGSPDQFHVGSGRAIGFEGLMDEILAFVERQFEAVLELLESGQVWPREHQGSNS